MKNENPLNYMLFEEAPISFRVKIEKYLFNWRWFVIGVLLAFIFSYFYLNITPNQYLVSTTILIDDPNNEGLPPELSAFEDLGIITDFKKSIDNEIGVLKSRNLMKRVVKNLGINITYFNNKGLKKREYYKDNVPFKISFFSKDSLLDFTEAAFTIKVLSDTTFELKNKKDKYKENHVFGESITTSFGTITITPTTLKLVKNDEVKVLIIPLKTVVEDLRRTVNIDLFDKKSTIIQLSLESAIKSKAKDILNELVKLYNDDAVEDKRTIGNSTNDFITERLEVIGQDLLIADKSIVKFKTSNRLTDITSDVSLAVDNNAQIERKILEKKTQLKLADYVSDYLKDNSNELIPANLGLNDGTVNLNTENYNKLLLERNRILKGSSTKNPVIVNLDDQLNQLKGTISQGLQNLKSTLSISLDDAINQENRANSRITNVPKQEKEYRDIQRQQKIVETLYLYLSQKREENLISLAVTVPNSKVIDVAEEEDIPVFPKPKIIYLTALILGLLIPFIVLYILFLFDNKVHTVKEIEAVVKAPFLGDIPKSSSEIKLVAKNNQDSISESFRMLRTNLTFMLSNIKERAKTIFVTSTIEDEGKSFVSANLATVLALSNKKVILIGADLRKPKLDEYFNIDIKKGLTNFLIDDELQPSDIIYHTNEDNLDIIATVFIAPNSSELLLNGRFEKLITYCKEKYDFIIVDTAPVKIITDTFIISQQADMFLYVIRANYLDKSLLEIPQKLYSEKRLPNLAVILNKSDTKKGYGYGYAYEEILVKNKWWKPAYKKIQETLISWFKKLKRLRKTYVRR